MYIVYGTTTFFKKMTVTADPKFCTNCGSDIPAFLVRSRKWAHCYYIPLFPVKTLYYRTCPICGTIQEMSKEEARHCISMHNPSNDPGLEFHAKRILDRKPKSLLDPDLSYEFWVKNTQTGHEQCLAAHISHEQVEDMKKCRGLDKIKTIKVLKELDP